MGKGLQNLLHSVVHIQMGLRHTHVHYQSLPLGFRVKPIGCQIRGGSRQTPSRFLIEGVIFCSVSCECLPDGSFIGFQIGTQGNISALFPGCPHRAAHSEFHAAILRFEGQLFHRQLYPQRRRGQPLHLGQGFPVGQAGKVQSIHRRPGGHGQTEIH